MGGLEEAQEVVRAVARQGGLLEKYRGTLVALSVLIIISPIFGIILAEKVNYHEPIDVMAEKLHLHEADIYNTPFDNYQVPGLPPTLGYIVAGFIGIAVILGIGLFAARRMARS